jgi:23S rRNA pseudouridine1911/1915/1917 synthase
MSKPESPSSASQATGEDAWPRSFPAQEPGCELNILHEDNELLVLNKPAGLVCHPSKAGPCSSLVGRVRVYLGQDQEAQEAQLVHRLDRETSGVLILGKTAEVGRELRLLWEEAWVTKEYLAIVHGHIEADKGIVDAPLGPAQGSAVAIQDEVRPDGRPARTLFWVDRRWLWEGRPFSLVRLRLETGRKHQIRIHLAHLGHPIVGDKLYGGDPDIYLALVERRLTQAHRQTLMFPNQALHAHRIWFPWRGTEQVFQAPCEPVFTRFLEGTLLPWAEDPYDHKRLGS